MKKYIIVVLALLMFVPSPLIAEETTRVSVTSGGTEGDFPSNTPSISSDGRYVAFDSLATNLVAGDTNGTEDVFVHDRNTGKTTRVSVDSIGTEGDDSSYTPSISSDGRYVAFDSFATNLVAGDTNKAADVFVYDQAPDIFTVYVPSSADNGIDGDGKSTVLIGWVASTSSDIDHYEIVARVGAAPDETDTVAGQTSILPGTQVATFNWNSGDILYVGVVAVDTMGFRALSLNGSKPYIIVAADTPSSSTTTAAVSTTTTPPGSTTTTIGPASTTTTSPLSTFTLAGTITGEVSEGVTVILEGDLNQNTVTDPGGRYEFLNLPEGVFFIVRPELEGYVFDPPQYEVSNLTNDVLNMDFMSSVAPLCPTEVIYGEDSEEVELLRTLRDEVLSKTPEGREIIKQYYNFSPLLVETMKADDGFKNEVENMIDEVLMIIR
jgi:hypothetical protein